MMGSKGRGLLLAAFATALALAFCAPALAEGLPLACSLVAEDVGNGYQYSVAGIGTFSINCKDGETVKAALIALDEGCEAALYKNGEKTDFANGMILDNGSYELRIYPKGNTGESYGLFHFTVKNTYEDVLGQGQAPLQTVVDPLMKLAADPGGEFFTYTLPDGETIRSNVPQGGQADRAAKLELSSQLSIIRVLKDGQPLVLSETGTYDRSGSYQIVIQDNALGLNGSTAYEINYCFLLYGQGARAVDHVNAPMGFELDQVIKDGRRLPVKERDYAQLREDGSYQLVFSQVDGAGRWTMKVKRDTTPPCIHFLQAMPPDGEMKEDVAYLPPGSGDTLTIYRNGQQVEAPGNRIALNGKYELVTADAAGNEREYHFVLRRGFHIVTKEWIVIPFILLGAGAGIALYWRRNMRVL